MVKTVILIVVILLLSAGVYFGISRITSKPPVAPSNNQFVEDLDELVKKMGETMDEVDKDGASANLLSSIGNDYSVFSHKLKLYKEEQLIDATEYEAEVDNLNGSFALKYANYYLKRFKTSEWNSSDIDNIRIMVKDLTSFCKKDNTLSELTDIIDIFDQATVCANSVECRSKETAKTKIAAANRYLGNEYIKNNHSLCSQLRSLPRRLAENHYEYIEQLVANLSPRNYQSTHGTLNEVQYDDALEEAQKAIYHYEQQRDGYGKEAPSTEKLKKQLLRYRETIFG